MRQEDGRRRPAGRPPDRACLGSLASCRIGRGVGERSAPPGHRGPARGAGAARDGAGVGLSFRQGPVPPGPGRRAPWPPAPRWRPSLSLPAGQPPRGALPGGPRAQALAPSRRAVGRGNGAGGGTAGRALALGPWRPGGAGACRRSGARAEGALACLSGRMGWGVWVAERPARVGGPCAGAGRRVGCGVPHRRRAYPAP